MRKMIVAAAATMMALGSPMAFAQNAPTTAETPMGTDMSSFYSDSDMKTMRPDAELREQLAKMNPEAREQLRKDCETPKQHRENTHHGLCEAIDGM